MALALFSAASFAQISTGEPTTKVYKTGNRAEAGDFGLYLGVKTDLFRDLFDSGKSIAALPLINLKYMATDHIEARLGIEFYQTTAKINGDLVDNGGSVMSRKGNTDFLLYPGFAYHFSRHNILDVYAGVELPIGWNSVSSKSEATYEGETYSEAVTKRSFVVGLGAFIGLQAYVGKLPLAVGLEYGISSQFDTGLKYKHEVVDGNNKQTWFTPDAESFKNTGVLGSGEFDKLAAKKGKIGNQVRITLTYYFK